jgi:RHS repeat-associated protein
MPNHQVVWVTDGLGSEIGTNVFGIDEPLKTLRGAQDARYLHHDAQRSVRQLTNASGAAVDSEIFDAFGVNLAASGNSVNPYGYAGEEVDPETELIYLRARQYDPETGRFMGMDPMLGFDGDPRTLDRYSYAAQDPLSMRDPSGRFLGSIGVSIGALSSLVNIAATSPRLPQFYNIRGFSSANQQIRLAIARNHTLAIISGLQHITDFYYQLIFDRNNSYPSGANKVRGYATRVSEALYNERISFTPLHFSEQQNCPYAGSDPDRSAADAVGGGYEVRICEAIASSRSMSQFSADSSVLGPGLVQIVFHEVLHAVPAPEGGENPVAHDPAGLIADHRPGDYSWWNAAFFAGRHPRLAVRNSMNWELAGFKLHGWASLPSLWAQESSR